MIAGLLKDLLGGAALPDAEPLPVALRRPGILTCGNVPKPMHGLAPRVVLGKAWWDRTRRAAAEATGRRCLSCGAHWSAVKGGSKWLEGHELYDVDWSRGIMRYVETVPLCSYCHLYIHDGRMLAMVDQGRMDHRKYALVIQHGDGVLAAAGLTKPPPYDGPVADWTEWHLVVGRTWYRGLHDSLEDWLAYHEIAAEADE